MKAGFPHFFVSRVLHIIILTPPSPSMSLLSLSRSFSLCLSGCLSGWPAGWPAGWLTGWLIDLLADSIPSHSMSLPSLSRDLSGSLALSFSSLSSFTPSLLCHLVSPITSLSPHLPHPLSPSLPPPSLFPSLSVYIASSLCVELSLVARNSTV